MEKFLDRYNNSMRKLLMIGLVTVGVVGLASGVAWVFWVNKSEQVLILDPLGTGRVVPTPGVYLQKPVLGNTARLVAMAGETKLIPWDKPDEEEAKVGMGLVQGDAIKTGADGRAKITIDEIGQIEIEGWTSLTLASLQAETVAVKQDGGQGGYMSSGKLAVRLKSALVEAAQGEWITKVDGNTIRIDVKTGEVKIGYVDYTGRTKVWQVGAGKWLSIDDGRRRVRTTGLLVASAE